MFNELNVRGTLLFVVQLSGQAPRTRRPFVPQTSEASKRRIEEVQSLVAGRVKMIRGSLEFAARTLAKKPPVPTPAPKSVRKPPIPPKPKALQQQHQQQQQQQQQLDLHADALGEESSADRVPRVVQNPAYDARPPPIVPRKQRTPLASADAVNDTIEATTPLKQQQTQQRQTQQSIDDLNHLK